MQRILGIDPGSRVTGYGLIESNGRKSRYLASGCIRAEKGDFSDRLGIIFHGVVDVVQQYEPDELAIEQVFVARNAGSALKLGQARGAAICAALTGALKVHEYSPRSVKQAVVGTGGADKVQVQHMVKMILSLSQQLAEDEADALAVALCHAHSNSGAGKLEAALRGGQHR